MTRFLIFAFIGLTALSVSAFGQTNACKMKIVRLQFDKSQQVKPGEITDSLLALATPTNSVLVNNAEVIKFDVKTDTACCTYAGQMIMTSHHYLLTSKAVSTLSALDIPLCCGIPAAIYIDNKEVYRVMLWNLFSSFGNKSLTMTFTKNSLTVVNQLPVIPDFRNSTLTSKSSLPDCLLDKQKLTKK